MLTYQGGCLNFHLVCVNGCGGAVVLGADLMRGENSAKKKRRSEEEKACDIAYSKDSLSSLLTKCVK